MFLPYTIVGSKNNLILFGSFRQTDLIGEYLDKYWIVGKIAGEFW